MRSANRKEIAMRSANRKEIAMRTAIALLTVSLTIGSSLLGHAAILAEYSFGGDSPSSTDTDDLSAASDFSATGFAVDYTTQGNPAPALFADSTETTDGGAAPGGDYWEFTVTPTGKLTLTSLEFDVRTVNNLGSTSDFYVRSSVDSFSSDLYSILGNGVFGYSDFDPNIDLTGGAFDNLTSAVTFRFYPDPQFEIAGRGYAMDNVVLQGTAIPEPASFVVLGLAALFCLRHRQ